MCKSFVFFFLFSLSFLERITNENSFPLSSAGIIIFLRKYDTMWKWGEIYRFWKCLEDIFGGRRNVSSRMKLRIKILLAKCQFLSLMLCHVSMTIRQEQGIKKRKRKCPPFLDLSTQNSRWKKKRNVNPYDERFWERLSRENLERPLDMLNLTVSTELLPRMNHVMDKLQLSIFIIWKIYHIEKRYRERSYHKKFRRVGIVSSKFKLLFRLAKKKINKGINSRLGEK